MCVPAPQDAGWGDIPGYGEGVIFTINEGPGTSSEILESEWMGLGASPVESPAPLTTAPPGANQNVRAAFEQGGATTGDEFGPAECQADWEAALAGLRDAIIDQLDANSALPIDALTQYLRAGAPAGSRERAQYDYARNG